jgi:hypothetical protein
MTQSKFKSGQQWLTRDGCYNFHILSANSEKLFCIGLDKDYSGVKLWFYADTGQLWYNTESDYDLVILVKDVE